MTSETAEVFEAVAEVHRAARDALGKAKRRTAGAIVEETGKRLTGKQLLEALRDRAEVAFAVQPGKRPKFVKCEKCKSPVLTNPTGALPKLCKQCRIHHCSGCGKTITQWSKSGLCRSCRMVSYSASLTPEQKKERGRKGAVALNASLTPDQKRDMTRKAVAAMQASLTTEQRRKNLGKTTSAQRREAGKKGAAALLASLTPEQLQERLRNMRERLTPEKRREASKKGAAKMNASRTRESRAEAARKSIQKAWETRRARAAAKEQP